MPTLMYSLFEDTESRRALVIEMDEEPSSGDSSSASFLSGDGEIAVEASRRIATRPRKSRPTPSAVRRAWTNWDFDYSVSYAYAEEHEKDTQDPTLFAAGFEDPGALGIRWDYSRHGVAPLRDLRGRRPVSLIRRPTKSTRSSWLTARPKTRKPRSSSMPRGTSS
jgi:hypothetical protein